MLLLVGLGNPGGKYQANRHNIGFMAAERVAARHGIGPWRKRFQGQLAEGTLGGDKLLLLMPQTFMNESGRAVAEAARFYKLDPAQIVVAHDELDLAPGKLRVKTGGGAAGHNGLRSIDACLGSKSYRRLRLGIGHPGDKARVLSHVLGDFSKSDQEWLAPFLDALADALPLLVRGEDAAFMSRVAELTRPPKVEAPAKPKPRAADPAAATAGKGADKAQAAAKADNGAPATSEPAAQTDKEAGKAPAPAQRADAATRGGSWQDMLAKLRDRFG